MKSTNPTNDNYTILVVDDDYPSFLYIEAALRVFGCKLIYANNGKDAIDIAVNQEINLVLMDICLPMVSGIDATKQIRKVKPFLPIIAQTAALFPDQVKAIKDSGCDVILAKPFQINELYEVVQRVLIPIS